MVLPVQQRPERTGGQRAGDWILWPAYHLIPKRNWGYRKMQILLGREKIPTRSGTILTAHNYIFDFQISDDNCDLGARTHNPF